MPTPSADPLGLGAARPAPRRPTTQEPAPIASAIANLAPTIPSAAGVCTVCGSGNPASYRFCAICGGPVKLGSPGASHAGPPAVPAEALPKAGNASRFELHGPATLVDAPIVGAPVVVIADASEPALPTVTCVRCHGQCTAGARFCKYCGASLAGGTSDPALRSPLEKTPEPALAQASMPASQVPTARAPSNHPAVAAPTAHGDLAAPPASARPKPPPPRESVEASARIGGERLPPSPIADLAAATFVGTSRIEEPAFLGRLVVLIEDGSEGKSYDLEQNQVDIGRTEGDIALFDDEYVSPRHARLLRVDGRWHVRDLGSTNGVYARTRGPRILESGDLILLGLQVLQFHPVSEAERNQGAALRQGALQHGTRVFGSKPVRRLARLEQRTIEGVAADVYNLFRDETVIGREVGDIVFTSDPFLSRKHAAVRRKDGVFSIEDLGSSNGTYVAIKGDTVLHDGDRIRVGQHLFRLDLTQPKPVSPSRPERSSDGSLHSPDRSPEQPAPGGSKNAS